MYLQWSAALPGGGMQLVSPSKKVGVPPPLLSMPA